MQSQNGFGAIIAKESLGINVVLFLYNTTLTTIYSVNKFICNHTFFKSILTLGKF